MQIFCKICGMTQQEDLTKAAELGAKMCGFIFHPKSPRAITAQKVREFNSHNMLRVGVFVEQERDEILEIMQIAQLDFAQLHGNQSIECAQTIGKEKIIRVLWPEKYHSPVAFQKDIDTFHDSCAYYLFDAGKLGGGSGNTIDLQKLSPVKNLHKPWILAGGIGSNNVVQILTLCKDIALPQGIDCNSALEVNPGIKDHKRMEKLFATLKDTYYSILS